MKPLKMRYEFIVTINVHIIFQEKHETKSVA